MCVSLLSFLFWGWWGGLNFLIEERKGLKKRVVYSAPFVEKNKSGEMRLFLGFFFVGRGFLCVREKFAWGARVGV